MNIKVFTMTHKDFEFHKSADRSVYIPLHVGRALTQYAGRETHEPGRRDDNVSPFQVLVSDIAGDDTGDNISGKNLSFCELTGLYWVWKNADCDVAGMAQYRRFFIEGNNNDILSGESMQNLLSKHDMLISAGEFVAEKSVRANYEKWHHIRDLELTEEAIGRLYPKDLPSFELAMSSRLFSGGNLFIAKKEVFDEYCKWLFDILFEVEKYADLSGYDDYQKRLYGFLSERLIRVFALARKYCVGEMRVGILN